MSSERVGTLRAASEENTGVIISRESHESREILLYAFGGIDVICVSKKPRTLHADVPTLTAHRSLLKTQKLVLLFFCQKSKSAVICRICVICVPSKFFTKLNFRINPAGKSKVPSWKIFISQLENYFFSVGKSKFRSSAIWGGFLGLFLNYFKQFLFILKPMSALWTKVKMFDSER